MRSDTADKVAKVLALKKEGKTLQEIAGLLHMKSASLVHHYLSKGRDVEMVKVVSNIKDRMLKTNREIDILDRRIDRLRLSLREDQEDLSVLEKLNL